MLEKVGIRRVKFSRDRHLEVVGGHEVVGSKLYRLRHRRVLGPSFHVNTYADLILCARQRLLAKQTGMSTYSRDISVS